MCNGTSEAEMAMGPQVIFLALKKCFAPRTEAAVDAHSAMCFCALMLCRITVQQSLVECLRISFLTLQYLVSELKKSNIVIWDQKQVVLRGKSSACVLQTRTRNVTFPYKDAHTRQVKWKKKNPTKPNQACFYNGSI